MHVNSSIAAAALSNLHARCGAAAIMIIMYYHAAASACDHRPYMIRARFDFKWKNAGSPYVHMHVLAFYTSVAFPFPSLAAAKNRQSRSLHFSCAPPQMYSEKCWPCRAAALGCVARLRWWLTPLDGRITASCMVPMRKVCWLLHGGGGGVFVACVAMIRYRLRGGGGAACKHCTHLIMAASQWRQAHIIRLAK